MSMVPPSPRFDTTINYGHLLTVATIIITLGGGVLYNVREQALLSHRVATLESTVKVEIAKLQADALSRVAQYAPTITALNKSQDLQDERISNIVDAVKETRSSFTAIAATLAEVKQDVAIMRVQSQLPAPSSLPALPRPNIR